MDNEVCCPVCGSTLRLMATYRSYTEDGIVYSRVFACGQCYLDWEADGAEGQPITELRRKFWG